MLFDITLKIVYFKCSKLQLHHYKYDDKYYYKYIKTEKFSLSYSLVRTFASAL